MSVRKEKKLKRLKNQKIWPHILGIFLMILIFGVMTSSVLVMFFTNLLSGKMQQGYENTEKIVQIFEKEWEGANNQDVQEMCDNIMTVMSSVEDICVLDGSDNVVHSYGGAVPDLEYPELSVNPNGIKIYLLEDSDSLITIRDNEIHFDFDKLDFNKLLNFTDENFLWKSNAFASTKVWYIMPFSEKEGSLCVKNVIVLEQMEVVMAFAAVLVVTILALFLIVYYLIAVISLIWEWRKMTKILHTDIVTGGTNLSYFHAVGAKRLKKNRKNKKGYVVASLRMEKYQNFCTCYGVKAGMELLERLHDVLQKGVEKKEIAAHAENGFFALLLHYTTEEQVKNRLEQMMAALEGVRPGQKLYFSVGLYKVEDMAWDIDRMYNCAKVARSRISEDSENRIVWFNKEMQEQQIWTRKVENDMERALENKEFQVYLQPKYSTKGERLSGAEALVRWIHPTEGFVPPYRFIPIFENNGFVLQLDDYMITEVARQQAKWIAEGKEVVPISVNVSRVHFTREDLAEHICKLVDQFQVPHHVIELELTESAFFDDKDALLRTLKKLKDYGFTLSMDDFGAGYSSLNSLKELPLDVVKLDAEFFRNTDADGRGNLIVGDTIALAKKLNMRIVAEGIETREQVDFLATKDCDLIQGYYFAKPMPITEFEEKAFQ